jgi:predicted permease
MGELLQDVRYAARGLLQRPGFTAVAILSLALGIGANTTIYTCIQAVFLQPLPVADISRLVAVYTVASDIPGYLPISRLNFVDYREQAAVFSDLALVAAINLSLSGAQPEAVDGLMVSARYFDLLGVRPVLGRGFLPEEDRIARPVVVLGYGLWQRRFGSDPRILGRPIRLNGREVTVVGVAPRGFHGTDFVSHADFWVPAGMYQQVLPRTVVPLWQNRRVLAFGGVGRLAPGMSPHLAEAVLRSLSARLAREYPDANRNRSVALVPLGQAVIDPNSRKGYTRAAGLLAAMVGLILLIACANLANMLLVRASRRRKEIAIRIALGGRRSHLVRQLLTESLLLSLAASAAGLLLAAWSLRWISHIQSPYLPASLTLGLDGRVLLVTLALSLLTALLFGLAPALATSRPDLVPALKSGIAAAAGAAGPGRRLWLRDLLIVGQVGLSVVVLAGALLFLRSLRNAQRIDTGFERERLAVFSFDLDSQGFDEAHGAQFLRQLAAQAAALPGVRSAAIGENLMLADSGVRHILLVDSPAAPTDQRIIAQASSVGPGYFETLGIPILRGRALSPADRADSRPVVVINQTLADRFWHDQSPLGKRFTILPWKRAFEIVGVVPDVKYNSLGEEPQLYLYLPIEQEYTPAVTLHVRTRGEPGTVVGSIRAQIQALAPAMPLIRATTMTATIGDLLWAPRACAVLLAVFGAAALVLVTIGIYGVIAHSIAERRREIGIRMALGARPADVVALFLRQGFPPVAIGLACGLAGGLLAVRTMADLLFGVAPEDPLVFLVTFLLLAAVSTLANYLPTRRATAVSPLIVMRQE